MDGAEGQPVRPVLEHQRRNAQSGDAGVDVLIGTGTEQDDLAEFLPVGHPADDHLGQVGGGLAATHGRLQPWALGGERRPRLWTTEQRPILAVRLRKPGR